MGARPFAQNAKERGTPSGLLSRRTGSWRIRRGSGYTRPFFQRMDFVYGKIFEVLGEATGPANFKRVDLGRCAEAEVNSHVALRVIA